MATSDLIKVFVYGTLKRGEPNSTLITDPANGKSQFVTAAKTVEKYPLVLGTRHNIPMLLNKKGTGNHVDGEIYEVDQVMLAKLDDLEQHPDFYVREIQDFETEDGSIVPCWIYFVKRYPEVMLSRKFLTSYKNSEKCPYRKSKYVGPQLEEIFADMAVNYEGVSNDSR